ncbi:MAG TPA: hypothetical protein VHQ41_04135 [Patescibacteria group bacterium]|jgi:hypothetical protein|nr:hypothetical protein [Patescibacteria group bacterium]
MKKFITAIMTVSMAMSFALFGTAQAVSPTWNTTGSYAVDFTCTTGCGGTYTHDLTLSQDSFGALTGNGGYPAGGPHVYSWVLTSGAVSGYSIDFTANYTASADAVTPQTTMHVNGSIAGNGSMSGTWTDNYQGGSRGGTFVTSSGHATLISSGSLSFHVVPSTYDPDHLGTAVSMWKSVGTNPTYPTDKDACKKDGWKNSSFVPAFKNQGQCVSYVANLVNLEQILVLQKNDLTTANEAAGADITGEEGIILTSLGFDYKTSGYCSLGSPRFNVYTTSGVYYFFGCNYGTHTDLGNGWTRVTFNNADAFPSDGTTVFPGFGSTTVTNMEIVMDESGQATLDNIMINGSTVGGM